MLQGSNPAVDLQYDPGGPQATLVTLVVTFAERREEIRTGLSSLGLPSLQLSASMKTLDIFMGSMLQKGKLVQ